MSRHVGPDHSRGPFDGGDPCEQIFYAGHHSQLGPEDFASASSSLGSGDDTDSDVEDIDSTCRISVRGPTIRFHSRAPWEMSDTEERDESTYALARLTAKVKGKSTTADGLVRTLARASPVLGRQSVESGYSQENSTPSLEFSANGSPHRAILCHGSGHMPASSTFPLVRVPSPTLPHNAEPYDERAGSLSSHHSSTEDSSSCTTRGHGGTSPTHHGFEVSRSSTDAISAHSRSPTRSSRSSQECSPREGFVHPYANPNLIIPYSSNPSQRSDLKRSDSITTVTDTISSRSTSSAIPRDSSEVSPISKDTQNSRRLRKKEISSPSIIFHGNDINPAYLDRDAKFLSLHPPLRGSANPPPVALISLEEAQAREKSRTASIYTGTAHSKAVDSTSRIPFSHLGDLAAIPNNQNNLGRMSNSVRPRARSISASARAKTALHSMVGATSHSERRDPGPSSSGTSGSRALKHKKSGFLRLFSGRGDGDQPSPPPVPSLHDTYVAQGLRGQLSEEFPEGSLSRNTELHLDEGQDPGCEPTVLTTRKLLPPPLNIDIGTSSHFTSIPNFGPDVQSRPHGDNSHSASSLPLNVPQSAPSTALDFQALQLRPVSSLFSAHFAEYVGNSDADTSLDSATTSPTSNSGAMLSPLTPLSSRPSNDEPRHGVGVSGEHSSVIKALQEQILSANKAWQRQVQDLQQQVRDLQAKVEELRAADNKCEVCRRVVPLQRLKDDESY